MAIIRTKQDSLSATKLAEATSGGKPNQDEEKLANAQKSKGETAKKKGNFLTNFIATTFEELKKSQWPSFSYVARWGSVIIIFTAIFSLVLGFFDNTFNSGIRFVDCTSTKSRNQSLNSCTTEFLQKVTYR
jgi:preprotein translocase SecE subunit